MNTSYVFLAEGFEEIEALTVVDVLRRAGMDVKTVSVTPLRNVRGAHGIEVVVDELFQECGFEKAEWLICPGGLPGASNLAACEPLCELLKGHRKGIAAICAAPAVVLAPLGLVEGKPVTCYPGFEKACKIGGGDVHTGVAVVAANDFITAAGPATALPFALEIVKQTLGTEVADELAAGMLVQLL